MSENKYEAVEKDGRMFVMKPGGEIAICSTAKFQVVTEPDLLRQEAQHIATALNALPKLVKALEGAQWAGGRFKCPWCQQKPVSGHAAGCIVGIALHQAKEGCS